MCGEDKESMTVLLFSLEGRHHCAPHSEGNHRRAIGVCEEMVPEEFTRKDASACEDTSLLLHQGRTIRTKIDKAIGGKPGRFYIVAEWANSVRHYRQTAGGPE